MPTFNNPPTQEELERNRRTLDYFAEHPEPMPNGEDKFMPWFKPDGRDKSPFMLTPREVVTQLAASEEPRSLVIQSVTREELAGYLPKR